MEPTCRCKLTLRFVWLNLAEIQSFLRFSKPEVQISLSNSFNQNVNAPSITISAEEVKQIEAVAEPVRQSVKALYAQYRPSQGNGDQNANGSVLLEVQEKFANYRPPSGNGA